MEIGKILKMSSSSRILLAKEIWDSVPENTIELSDPIMQELDNRLNIHNSKEMKYYTLDEIQNKLADEKTKNK